MKEGNRQDKIKEVSPMAERAQPKTYLATIEAMLQSLKYGSVTIIVQDGKVIQIEKTEKLRI